MTPLRYIAIFTAAALTVVTIAFGAAFSADPAHIFRMPEAYGQIASLLQTGTPVGGLESPRHRLINRAFIAGLSQTPGTVILGSSRIQPFSPAAAGWPESLNLAVEGGDLGDHLYIYGLLRDARRIPARMIIVVDPYIFSPRRDLLSRNGEQAALRRLVDVLGVNCLNGTDYWGSFAWVPEILTLDYAIESILVLQSELRGRDKPVRFAADPRLTSTGFIKRPDGSVIFSREIRERSPTYVDDYAATVLEHPVGRGLAFTELDRCKVDVFSALLSLLKNDGVAVTLAMLPYHPKAYELLQSNSPVLDEVEVLVADLGRELSLPVLGAYDPARTFCSSREFLDMHHPKQSCSQRILESAAPQDVQD
ncbi:MAG: hypothetical protein RH942_02190 [Kiloniellaceae bacterium]